ncbi:MAG TPA: putative porin [Pyrinomonadaceae bacterium]|jgi:hypothetical protein
MTNDMRQFILSAVALCALAAGAATGARAQTAAVPAALTLPKEPAGAPAAGATTGGLFALDDMQRQLREQRAEIEEMRAALREQTRLIEELRGRVGQPPAAAPPQQQNAPAAARQADPGELLKRVEEVERRQEAVNKRLRELALDPRQPTAYPADAFVAPPPPPAPAEAAAQAPPGAPAAADAAAKKREQPKPPPSGISFGGDLRLRYESLFGQQNAAANPDNPGAFGNQLTARHRLRLRARFGIRGRVSDEFEWGLRLATGSFADENSTNQTLTDFYSRKPFTLDHAFLVYRPKALPGFAVQGGKFEATWTRTEMTWDNDVSAEGLMETYERRFEKSRFRGFALQAWQLPALERNAAFVLGADGRVDLDASGRAGRDLALYGAQARAELAPWKGAVLRLAASDLYWAGTQFITPAQFFGPNVQFPATVVIPASGSTPARTVTTQVSIPRDMLVAGNSNLGFSTASTNAVNRDGRLSSGYNMVDLVARLDLTTRGERWPVMLLFDFVTNTQTRDVVTAGPGGADLLLRNREGQGYWAEAQVGKDVLRLGVDRIARGDAVFNYTFLRIEKDAVLTPFNFSDIGQQSDVRAHRFIAAYAVDPRVTLSFTGVFTQRPNGLLGVFGQTPPGSLNRTLTRLQLDTILRF